MSVYVLEKYVNIAETSFLKIGSERVGLQMNVSKEKDVVTETSSLRGKDADGLEHK